jgi:hypothetical protein
MAGNRHSDRSIYHHVSELFVYSGLVLIFVTLVITGYERYTQRSRIAQSLTGISHIVDALQIYTIDHPHSDIQPLRKTKRSAGIFLSPVHNQQQHFAFLTTPHPYLASIPIDPFMHSIEKTDPHAISLHWVRVKQQDEDKYVHSHIAWGAFSVGPALALPDHYQIDYLQNVPLRAKPLRQIFFSPSNGLASYGILYKDSLGNYTDIVE